MTELVAGIVGRDPGVLVAFYREVMGFRVERELRFDALGAVVALRRGAARLKLFFPADDLDEPVAADPWFRPGGWRYAALHLDAASAVDDLAAAVGRSGGEVLLPASQHRPGARMALVVDPEGNVWELLFDLPSPDAPAGDQAG